MKQQKTLSCQNNLENKKLITQKFFTSLYTNNKRPEREIQERTPFKIKIKK